MRAYAEELVELVGAMLRYEPSERMTAQQALAHPFFATPSPSVEQQQILQQQLQLAGGSAALALAAAAAAAAAGPSSSVGLSGRRAGTGAGPSSGAEGPAAPGCETRTPGVQLAGV